MANSEQDGRSADRRLLSALDADAVERLDRRVADARRDACEAASRDFLIGMVQGPGPTMQSAVIDTLIAWVVHDASPIRRRLNEELFWQDVRARFR